MGTAAETVEKVRIERLADGGAMVAMPRAYMESWLDSRVWPASGLTAEAFEVVFDRTGNLVDIGSQQDGPAMLALVGEAQAIAVGTGALPEQLTMTPDRVTELLQQAVALNEASLTPEDLKAANRFLGWEPKPVTLADRWFSQRWDIPSAVFHRDLRTDVSTTDGRPVAHLGRTDGTMPDAADLSAYRVMTASLALLRARDALDDAVGQPRRELPLSRFADQHPVTDAGEALTGMIVTLPGISETLIRRPETVEPGEFEDILAVMASGPALLHDLRSMVALHEGDPDLAGRLADARDAVWIAEPPIKVLSHDGVERYRGTDNECFSVLLGLQGQSVDWAMKWGGWTIEPEPVASPGHGVDAAATAPAPGR